MIRVFSQLQYDAHESLDKKRWKHSLPSMLQWKKALESATKCYPLSKIRKLIDTQPKIQTEIIRREGVIKE